MSDSTQLPTSAKRDYHKGSQIGGSNIGEPGQDANCAETWRVDSGDTTSFLNTVYGYSEVVGGFGGAVSRVVPLRHPEYPFLLATSFSSDTKGFDGNSQFNGGRFWRYRYITVQFKSRPYALNGQNAFLSRGGQPSSRQFPGPASGFLINGHAPLFDPGESIMGEDFTWSTHQLASLPISAYNGVRDRVNSSAFFEYPAGTVLYNGPTYNETSGIAGLQTWEVSHSFSYSSIGWNYAYENGVLYPITRVGGALPKLLADLTTIFSAA